MASKYAQNYREGVIVGLSVVYHDTELCRIDLKVTYPNNLS